ncbi:putative transcriptional regulator cudA [Sycon ciliatum]|uniref:putative transcriptional regulator cudA n=1 Tax=Sycon ciliatum TaxID=27933 RepID=UPI0031F690DD
MTVLSLNQTYARYKGLLALIERLQQRQQQQQPQQQQPQEQQPKQQQQQPQQQQQTKQQQQPQDPPLPPATTGSSLQQLQYGNTPTAFSPRGPSGRAVYADTSSPYYRPGNRPVQHGHPPYSGYSVKALSGHQRSVKSSSAVLRFATAVASIT